MKCNHPDKYKADIQERVNQKGELWHKWVCKKCKKTVVGRVKNQKLL